MGLWRLHCTWKRVESSHSREAVFAETQRPGPSLLSQIDLIITSKSRKLSFFVELSYRCIQSCISVYLNQRARLPLYCHLLIIVSTSSKFLESDCWIPNHLRKEWNRTAFTNPQFPLHIVYHFIYIVYRYAWLFTPSSTHYITPTSRVITEFQSFREQSQIITTKFGVIVAATSESDKVKSDWNCLGAVSSNCVNKIFRARQLIKIWKALGSTTEWGWKGGLGWLEWSKVIGVVGLNVAPNHTICLYTYP